MRHVLPHQSHSFQPAAMKFKNRMVLTQSLGFLVLPVIAVGLAKFYGDSAEETEKKLERMAFDDHVRTREGGKDVATMHDFIRKQATNQEADYSAILASGRGKVKRQKDLE